MPLRDLAVLCLGEVVVHANLLHRALEVLTLDEGLNPGLDVLRLCVKQMPHL